MTHTDTITVDNINSLTPEELQALNSILFRKLAKRIAIKVAVSTAVVVGVKMLVNKIDVPAVTQ
jgi:F0F1-type ATP synthase delta subunit